MPLLLYIYLATEILAPFVAALLILNAILFLGRLLPLLEGLFSFGIGVADFVRLWAYMSPQLLLFSIPMASMLAVIICFTRLSSDNEIIALKAAGISLYKMLPPVILFTIATSALTGLSSVYLIPHGTVASKQLLFQLAREKIDKGVRERQFSEGLADVVLYTDRIDPDTGVWHGVYISDRRDARTPVTVIASEGRIQSHPAEMRIALDLNDGSMHRAMEDVTQTIHFKRYELNLPVQTPDTEPGDPDNTRLDKRSMSPGELLRHAERLGADSPRGIVLLIEFHNRLVLPAGCFILSMLGLPLALSSRPGRRPMGLPVGLSIFILYYIAITAAKSFSESTALPVGPTMWLPNLFFGLLAIYLLRNAAREKQGHLLEYGRHLASRLAELWPFSGGQNR
jgi:lipopolysaccharide export system permease protein